MSRKNMRAVVVYLPDDVVRKIDAMAKVQSFFQAKGEPTMCRSRIVCEYIEKMVAGFRVEDLSRAARYIKKIGRAA